MGRERLQKILARAGFGSRRTCETIITEGRVTVNREVVSKLGSRADAENDDIRVDGKPLPNSGAEKLYLMLHKPSGFITSLHDPQGRPVVSQLLPSVPHPVYPVGRLDLDTTGLLLFTNDGDMAHGLTHPSRKVPKTYLVQIQGHPTPAAIRALQRGVRLQDGMTAPARVKVLEHARKATSLRMIIHEGRKRQIKRMCTEVGHPVLRLHRVAIGPVTLGNLGPGECRQLTNREVLALRRITDVNDALKARPATR